MNSEMKTFEVVCTADAEITERWKVTAADAGRAKDIVLGDSADTDAGENLEFVEQISCDHEENRYVDTIQSWREPKETRNPWEPPLSPNVPPNLSIWPFGVNQLMLGHRAMTYDDGRGPLGFVFALAVPDDMDTTQECTLEAFEELRDRNGPQLALTFTSPAAVEDMIARLRALKGEMLAASSDAATGCTQTESEEGVQ